MKQSITVSSFSPGRVRLRLESGHEVEVDLHSLLEIPAIRELTFRKFTGSLLILYDAGRIDLRELIQSIEARYPDWRIETPTDGEFKKKYPRNLVIGQFFYYVGRFDREIHRQTSGNLDLGTTLFLFYLVWGSWEFLRAPVRPKWYDIFKELTGTIRHFQGIYEA